MRRSGGVKAGSGARVGRAMVVAFGAGAGSLVLNLFTGVLTARILLPEGRGEVAAIVAWATAADLIASIGFKESLAFLQSKKVGTNRALLGTALGLTAVLGALGLAVVELLLPLGFAAQREEVLAMARLYVAMLVPIMGAHALVHLLHGQQRFTAAALQRLSQPFLLALGLVALWVADRVSVRGVLTVHFASWTLVALGSFVVLWRGSGLAPPSLELSRRALSYGSKLYVGSLATLANVRLDMLVMPALLLAGDIGLYVVAVSAASIISGLFSQIRSVVFSVSARNDRTQAVALVERTLRLTLATAGGLALFLAVAAPVLVETVYGEEFAGAVLPLRLLLPGIVAWAATSILSAGLQALERPISTSVSQMVGVAVTVGGLAALLPTMGIAGAALTSTLSYSTVFLIELWLFGQEPEFDLRRALAPRRFAADVRLVLDRARGRLPIPVGVGPRP